MTRRYEIYRNEAGERLAVPCGFSIMAAVFDWIWALWLRLWLESAVLFILNGVLFATLYAAKSGPYGYAIAQVLQGLLIGAQARRLRALSAERPTADAGAQRRGVQVAYAHGRLVIIDRDSGRVACSVRNHDPAGSGTRCRR